MASKLSSLIAATAEKAAPVDADKLPVLDSAASDYFRHITWGALKTAMASLFATLAGKSGGQTLIGGTGNTDKLVLKGTSGNGTSTETALEVKVGNNGAITAMTAMNSGKITLNKLVDVGAASENCTVRLNHQNGSAYGAKIFTDATGMHIEGINTGLTIGGGSTETSNWAYGGGSNSDGITILSTNDMSYSGGPCAVFVSSGFSNSASGTGLSATRTLRIRSTYRQSASTAANTALVLENVNTNVGSGEQNFIEGFVDSASRFRISTAGALSLGSTAPSAKAHITASTEQLRLGYDATNYTRFTVSSAGNLTIDTVGDTIYTPDTIENTTSGAGIVLKSPDGTRYRITVANGGTLSVTTA